MNDDDNIDIKTLRDVSLRCGSGSKPWKTTRVGDNYIVSATDSSEATDFVMSIDSYTSAGDIKAMVSAVNALPKLLNRIFHLERELAKDDAAR